MAEVVLHEIPPSPNTLQGEPTARIEERLGDAPWLVGATRTADVVTAASIGIATVKEEAARGNPVVASFTEPLRLGAGRERTHEGADRVLAFDR